MKLFLDGHSLGYEMQALCFALFPGEKIECETEKNENCTADFVYTRIKKHRNHSSALVTVSRNGKTEREGECVRDGDYKKQCEFALGRALYRAAVRITGVRPPWGILTGIRPVKIVRSRLEEGLCEKEIAEEFRTQFYTSGEKIDLCLKTAEKEQKIVSLSRPESASLYISVPFCPSRCLYCSFISHDVEKSAKLVPDYVKLLCKELEATGKLADDLGLRLETIYMGGGTPTAFSAKQLETVLATVQKSFNLKFLREYTVEAGRPDTITRDKLDAILAGGARRISINPQTLDDAVLKKIGRAHTVEDVYKAFSLARKAKVPCINMDLIAGLPGDTPEGFKKTLEGVLSLDPEAVTVHTLAMKRSSRLVTEWGGLYDAEGKQVNEMHRCAVKMLGEKGFAPYYLYRQKNTLGGLENVGYSKPGFEGLYNVFIMDETHTILAAGAGGVTKMRQPGGSRIERVFNFKYPYEYISRFGEIIDRKRKVNEFYGDFRPHNRQG